MSFKTVWLGWRRKVHDILEVGGDAHPMAHVVNVFLVILIILNGIAFAAESFRADTGKLDGIVGRNEV